MERLGTLILILLAAGGLISLAFVFWRYVWFSRNPKRTPPEGENILSPADGKVVYVRKVRSGESVISTKHKRSILLSDLLRKDLDGEKLLIGVFMSPFDVHVNRSPLGGTVQSVTHYPPVHKNHNMTSMHWRTLLNFTPFYERSPHLITNERTVTHIRGFFCGEPLSCHVNQIAGGSVRGIESIARPGSTLKRGDILGRIKIGSQVDTVISWKPTMHLRVRPGMKVRAGESILVETLSNQPISKEEG